MPLGDVAKRARNPKEGAPGRETEAERLGRAWNGSTLKRSEAHEGMNPFAQASGGRREEKHRGLRRKRRGRSGGGEPNVSTGLVHTTP